MLVLFLNSFFSVQTSSSPPACNKMINLRSSVGNFDDISPCLITTCDSNNIELSCSTLITCAGFRLEIGSYSFQMGLAILYSHYTSCRSQRSLQMCLMLLMQPAQLFVWRHRCDRVSIGHGDAVHSWLVGIFFVESHWCMRVLKRMYTLQWKLTSMLCHGDRQLLHYYFAKFLHLDPLTQAKQTINETR